MHEYLIEKMVQHANVGQRIITYGQADWVLSRFMIPKKLRHKVMDELVKEGYLSYLSAFQRLLPTTELLINRDKLVWLDLMG